MTNDINAQHKLQTLQIDLESQSYIHNDQAVMYPRSCRRRGDQLAAKPRNDQADRVAKARADLQEKTQRKAMMEKNREVASGGSQRAVFRGEGAKLDERRREAWGGWCVHSMMMIVAVRVRARVRVKLSQPRGQGCPLMQ
jgi:hypothetical protein